MARIRTIKPELPQSEGIGAISRDARLLFIQLFTIADDAGRFRAPSRLLASLLYPYDSDAADLIDGWMDELVERGMVRRYAVNGQEYADIPKWLEHQRIDRPSPSRIPEFTDELASPREPSRAIVEPSTWEGNGRERKGRERTSDKKSDDSGFEEFYKKYPRHEGRGQAEKAYAGAIKIAGKDELLAGLDRALEIWRDTPKKFIPLPATWLNGKRWQDELEPGATSKPYRVEDDPAYRGVTW